MFRKILKYFLLAWSILFILSGFLNLRGNIPSSILAFIFAVFCFWGFKKLTQPPKTEEEKAEIRLKKEEEKKKKTEMKQIIKEHKKQMIEEEKAKHGNIEFEVAGTFLGGRQANISRFFNKKITDKEIEKYGGLSNSDIKTKKNIDKEIYEIPQEYEIVAEYPSELIRFEKEPENEHDKNAIRVMIKGMGTVGYVPKNRNISFAEIIDTKEIKKVVANVSGGNYKLWDGEELETDREDYSIFVTVYYN